MKYLKILNPHTAFGVGDPLIRTEHIATMFIRCICDRICEKKSYTRIRFFEFKEV